MLEAQLFVGGARDARADPDELLRFVQSAGESAEQPDTIFVTHGEPRSAATLATTLKQKLGSRTFIPELGDGYDLDELLASS